MGRIWKTTGKTTATIVAATTAVFVITACSNDGGTYQETKEKISSAATSEPGPGEALRSSIESTASSAISSASSAMSSAVSGISGAWDQAKLTAFTATFR